MTKAKATLDEVYRQILSRRNADPESSYVASLNREGEDATLRKIGEEAIELILAAKGGDRGAAIRELADLWFHVLVWMAQADISPGDVEGELGRRFGQSGLARKANGR